MRIPSKNIMKEIRRKVKKRMEGSEKTSGRKVVRVKKVNKKEDGIEANLEKNIDKVKR